MDYTIYCDMDGVLVDFDKGFKTLSGYEPKFYEDKFGTEKFWQLINDGGVEWWENLEWMSDGRELWSYIKKYNPFILTAPSREPESKTGKKSWVKNHIKDKWDALIFSPAYLKCEYASKYNILIDDKPSTIMNWERVGGIGILHTSAKETIEELKSLDL
jgi:5'(3')-deoxyribonucleotidase